MQAIQPPAFTDLDHRSINTMRALCIDAIEKANSGHPGAPLGLASAAYVIWTRSLKHNPANPDWLNRDRFVLSGGHASMLLYSLLYLTGYAVTLDDIKQFRQMDSKTPGHPEYGVTPGVETTTGPLGQGFANAVGLAMAEKHLAARFNRPGVDIVDHFTYVMCGDGDMMEGIVAESASLAGHLGLSKLICIYDANRISIEGSTDITFTEDVGSKFAACGWQVLEVVDGNDLSAIETALNDARSDQQRPSLIVLRTEIAYGSPNKQGSADAHGAPLGQQEVCLTKECLGCPPDELFCVPREVLDRFRECLKKGESAENRWNSLFTTYRQKYPDLADQWVNAMTGFIPAEFEKVLPVFNIEDGPMATRAASGKVLNIVAGQLPTLMGGSADLAPSNNTYLNEEEEFQHHAPQGRNIRFGVREHAMGGIINGMFLHNGIRPYGGTFLVFADYMRPSIRLAALMKLRVIYIFTHDSIAVGEDGPTHQPVEHLASLRAIPGLTVIRPADANETAMAWQVAINGSKGPVALILSRQKLAVIDRNHYASAKGLTAGAYILADSDKRPDLILIATGAEVHLALEARNRLTADGIQARVVSMPSWELFKRMSLAYRNQVLPPEVNRRISVEAGSTLGWERFTGDKGRIIGIDHFGTSAPGAAVMERFGLSVDHILQTARDMLTD